MRFSPRSWLDTGLGKLLIFISLLLVLSSWGFYLVELRPTGHRDFLAAVWWAVVTLTTVGYGDIVPATPAGRVLGLLVMISGIGMVSTLTGNLASLLVEQKAKKRKGLLKVRLSGHVLILGWNSHARTLISSLMASGVLERSDVALVNTLPAEERENITYQYELGDKLHFVYGDPTLKNVLDRASPETAKMAYVLSQDGLEPKEADQQSLYTVLTLRSIASKLPIYAEVVLEGDQEHLIRAGVNETVIRGEISSLVLAGMGKSPVVWPFFRRLIGAEGNLLDFRRLTGEEKKGSWGEFLAKANRESGVLPVALCQEAKAVSLEDILDQGEALDSFIIELFTASGRKTELGRQAPGIIVNPAYEQSMKDYDGILFIKPGEARQA